MTKRIYYTKPSITELEISLANDSVKNGWGDKCYEYINRFEKLFSEHLGVKYALATSSCTGALHMGFSALGVGPRDEVIVADTNWIATIAPIVHLGATPVFVDVLSDSWCIDPNKIEQAITPKTKAIVAVHLYGNLCEMDSILAIGAKHNLPIIEDAAEAVGSVYKGRKAGSMGVFGTFSFHGTKTITTGEGGMLVCNDEQFFKKVETLSNHGRSKEQTKQFWPDIVGFKYKMSNIQAAIGCGQMQRIEDLIQRKRSIFHYYREALSQYSCIQINSEPSYVINGCWMPTIVFSDDSGVTRELLVKEFIKENIDARVFFWPLSSLDFFKSNTNNVQAHRLPSQAINLPSYHEMTKDDQNRVIGVIRSCIENF